MPGSLKLRMFDALSDRLEGILGRLRSRGRLSDADVDEALREIRTALLEADVDVGVARSLVAGIRARVVGEELSKSLSPGQQVVKAVHDQLIEVLGGETLTARLRVGTTDGHPPRRLAGLGQDHHGGEARAVVPSAGAKPVARGRRPPATRRGGATADPR